MISITKLKNGLTVIVEPLEAFSSVSYELHVSGGLVSDDEETFGNSLLLPDLSERGVAGMDSRAFSDAFDNLGFRHGTSVSSERFIFRGTGLADVFSAALELTSKQVLAATLPEQEVASIVELLKQDEKSLDDAPSRKVAVELSKRYLPHPFNRQSYIDPTKIEKLSAKNCRALFDKCVRPDGAILSVAGNVKESEVLKEIEKYFGDWSGKGVVEPKFTGVSDPFQYHIQKDTAQVQISLIYPSVKFGEPLFYTSKVCNEILSGGMFGRLFVEVREKRGLCYSVYSRHSGGKYAGTVYAYSGTTPERATDTLTVMLETIKGVKGTVTQEELDRAKVNLKSTLIISEESAASRAGSNAGDYWLHGRIRTLEEISKEIDKVTASDIDQYIEKYSPDKFSLVTLGPKPLI
jgi:predicted Zn-dependent peptidase